VTLIGRISASPDIRDLPEGGRVASFSVVTSDKSTEESDKQHEQAEFNRVLISSSALLEAAETHLHKGSLVYVEGSLRTRQWVDQNNVERYTTEIVAHHLHAMASDNISVSTRPKTKLRRHRGVDPK
jgi:single-strand DNA-binding protein